MIVLKFGGSLLNGPDGVRSVLGEIAGIEEDLLIVVSAFARVSNRLEQLAERALEDPDRARQLAVEIIEEHRTIGRELLPADEFDELRLRLDGYSTRLEELIEGLSITGELSRRTLDLVVHFGELLSSAIIASLLKAPQIPATELLITNNNHRFATVYADVSRQRVSEKLAPFFSDGEPPVRVVTEGYIARGEDGEITTMGRESSDFSAALFGRFLGAQEVRIYTGVPGVMTADPAICPEAMTIGQMSYPMAREIARLGAKVIHPRTIRPEEEEGIRLVLTELEGNRTEIGSEPGEDARSFPLLRDILHVRCQMRQTIGGDDEVVQFLRNGGPVIRVTRVGRRLDLILDPDREIDLVVELLRRFPTSVEEATVESLHLLSLVQDRPVTLDEASSFLSALNQGCVTTFWGDPDDRTISALIDDGDPERVLSQLHTQFLSG